MEQISNNQDDSKHSDVKLESKEVGTQGNEKDKVPKKAKRSIWRVLFYSLLGLATVVILVWTAGNKFGWWQAWHDKVFAASITITIQDEEKNPIKDAVLKVDQQKYTLDDMGSAKIEKVAGSYAFLIEKDLYFPAKGSLNLVKGENPTQVILLHKMPDKTYKVSGVVINAITKKPIVDAKVTLTGTTDKGDQLTEVSVASDPSGEFAFTKIPNANIQLVFSKGGYKGSSQVRAIKDVDVVFEQTSLVPEGSLIFTSNATGKKNLYKSALNGSDRTAFVMPSGDTEDFAPYISPNGQYVVFSSTRDKVKDNYGGNLSRLYVATSDGNNLSAVGSDVAFSFTPTWSPDSSLVYFSGYSNQTQSQAVYKVYNPVNKTLTDIGESVSGAVFSPDSKSIAYSMYSQVYPTAPASPGTNNSYTTSYALRIFNIAANEKKTIVTRAEYMSDLEYNNDGTSIFYNVYENNAKKRYQVNISTGEQNEVAIPDRVSRTYFRSKDGTILVFVDNRDGKSDLYKVDSKGENEVKLTDLGVVSSEYHPTFDATGSYVAFSIRKEGETAIYVTSTAGGITPLKVADFSSDGQHYGY